MQARWCQTRSPRQLNSPCAKKGKGKRLSALNGGSHFKFTDGISLSVDCKTQEEVDTYWEKLSEGGEPGACRCLKDRFGLYWQINPTS